MFLGLYNIIGESCFKKTKCPRKNGASLKSDYKVVAYQNLWVTPELGYPNCLFPQALSSVRKPKAYQLPARKNGLSREIHHQINGHLYKLSIELPCLHSTSKLTQLKDISHITFMFY